ncbi:MAG: addiction module protein [Elusimicrobia bacterium]|nr:addiction module protein [Elusimicrobiota bacterium]
MTMKKQEASLLRMPLKKRAHLAEQLIASLDNLTVEEREELWAEEAERRYQAYKRGKMSSSPSEHVFRNALKKIA